MKIEQARIVLTGAGGGIGQAVARELAQHGAALMLVGRTTARLAAQAQALGPRATWQAADLNDPAALQRLAKAAADWQANVLVHGAGVPAFGRLQAMAPADMQQLLATNLLAPMLLTQALLPHLLRQPRAQVLCLGSVLGRLALPGFSVYAASKFGLRGFAEALRRELADTTVRVQYLGPRSTRTAFNSAGVQAYNEATGTAMDTPETVAAHLMALLASGAAERFIGFPESLAVRINGAVPAWLDGSFKAHRRSLTPSPSL